MSTVSNVVLPKEKKVRAKKVAPVVEKAETPKSDSESEEKKPRKPTLSAKYTKFVVFGYSIVNALVAAGLIPDEEIKDLAYAQIKLMDSVEDQTAFYSNFLENLSASGKAMKKFVNDKKKPPKVIKEKKPRAKKVKADSESESESKAPKAKKVKAEPEPESESEPISEPKAKKPRAKKSVTVESDAKVDLISNLVNAAQAEAPVDASKKESKTKTKEPKETKAKEPKETKTKEPKETKTKTKAKKEEPTPVPVAPVLEAEEEDDDDEVIQTRETVIDGETFLVDQDGNLYDAETHEFIRKL